MKHKTREHQRIHLTFYIRVYEEDQFLGYLIDVSRGGIMAMSETPFSEGKEYSLCLEIPVTQKQKEKQSKPKTISFTARCLWSKPDEMNESFHLGGFSYEKIGKDEDHMIHQLVEDFRLK